MQNNPFNNFLSQWQAQLSGNVAPSNSSPENTAQPSTSVGNAWGNPAMMNQMQSLLARSGANAGQPAASAGTPTGASWQNKPSTVSSANEMSPEVFRQFQLQQTQSSPGSSAVGLRQAVGQQNMFGVTSPAPPASNIQATSTAWSGLSNSGNVAPNSMQGSFGSWNASPATQVNATQPAPMNWNNPAGMAAMMSMMGAFGPQMAAMQQSQANPMAAFMQMMQQMMPMAAMMPAVGGAQVPSFDNVAKQVFGQFLSQMQQQQSGPTQIDDSIQKAPQPTAAAISSVPQVKPETDTTEDMDTAKEAGSSKAARPVADDGSSAKKPGKGGRKGKAAEREQKDRQPAGSEDMDDDEVLVLPAEKKRGRQSAARAEVETKRPAGKRASLRNSPARSDLSTNVGKKPGDEGMPELVSIDSDDDYNDGVDIQPIESATEASSIGESGRKKKKVPTATLR